MRNFSMHMRTFRHNLDNQDKPRWGPGGQPIDPHVKCSRIFMKRIEIMNRYYFIQNYIEGKSNNTKELILVNITNNI